MIMNKISFGTKVFLDSPCGAKNANIRLDTNDVYLKSAGYNNTTTQIVNKYTDTNFVRIAAPLEETSKILDSLEDGDILKCNQNGTPIHIINESGETKNLDFLA